MALTPVFVCGFECGRPGIVGSDNGHWSSLSGGGAPAIVTTPVRTGTYALEITAAANDEHVRLTVASPTILFARFYLRFAALPTVDVSELFGAPTAGEDVVLGFQNSDDTLRIRADGGAWTAGPVIVANTWYQIDIRANIAANPWLIDWWVDGTAQTQHSRAVAAGSFTAVGFGTAIVDTFTAYYDDILIATGLSSDAPIGAGKVKGYSPDASGTHSVSTGSFRDSAGLALVDGETASWAFVDTVPLPISNVAPYVEQQANAAGGFLEYRFTQEAVETGDPTAVQAIAVLSEATSAAENQRALLREGATDVDIHALADVGTNTAEYKQVCRTTKPSGGAWTVATLNATRLRWGFSTDSNPDVRLLAAMLEVAFPEAASRVPRSTSYPQLLAH